jgi:dimethylargininase
MLKSEGDKLTRVVVCAPKVEYFNVDNFKAHNITEIADPEQTIKQHAELQATLKNFGCEVINIAELPGHPNSVFTRDMAAVTPSGYIKIAMGITTREGEEDLMASTLDSLGEPCVGEISAPGTVEGGDVIICGSVAFIGHTQRTNREGIRQFTEILTRLKYEVRVVEVPEAYLHLDQTIGVLGPNRLIHCSEMFPEELFTGFETFPLSCKDFNVNFICLGENNILATTSNPPIIKKARKLGVIVHVVDLSEFWKGVGGPNCLIMPLERK